MCDWRERWHEEEDEDMEETDEVDGGEDVDGGSDGGHEDEDEDDVTGTAGGRSVSRLSSETVTDPDLMFSCDVRDVVVVTPSISSIMSEDGMCDDSVPVTSGGNLRPNQKYHLTSSSSMITRCSSLHDDRLLTVGKSLTGSSGSHTGSTVSSIVVPVSHSSRANHRRRHRHQSVVDDLDDEADVVAAAAARVIRHTNQVHEEEDEEEDDPVACMDDEDGMVDLSLDIKHEKLLTVAVVDDDDDEVDEEDDVSCILRDPPLNHFKTSRIKTHPPVHHHQHHQQQHPDRNKIQPGHGVSIASAVSLPAVFKSTHTITPVARIPDSSCSSSVNGNSHRNTGQPLSALQQRSPLLGSLIANGVSSTTGSSAHLVSNSATLLPAAATPAATVVLTSTQGMGSNAILTSPVSQETLTVASSTTTTTMTPGNGLQHQQPLDIKILPAGIIQLASNLAAVFPNAGSGGQQKQQIAIQLLREDGTSIILPITTTTTTRSILQHQPTGATVTIKPETAGSGSGGATTTVLLQTATDHHNRQTIITTQNLVQQQQQQPKLQLVQHHNSIVQQQQQQQSSSAILSSSSQLKGNGGGEVTSNPDNNSCQQQQQQDSSSSSDSSDRPFKCELCNSTFTRLGNYTRHKKIHSLPTKVTTLVDCLTRPSDHPFLLFLPAPSCRRIRGSDARSVPSHSSRDVTSPATCTYTGERNHTDVHSVAKDTSATRTW